MSYIGPNELVFNNDIENGIHAGGFNVNSIMMKTGFSPIMTLNNGLQTAGSSNKVSDLFDNLVVPSWTLSYHNNFYGGEHNKHTIHNHDSEDDDVIDDDLHDKLLDLVKEHEIKIEQKKKRKTRKNNKHTNQKHKGTRKFQKV